MQHMLDSRWHLQDFPLVDFYKLSLNLKYPCAPKNGVILPRFLVEMQTMRMTVCVDTLSPRKAQIGQTHMVRMETSPPNSKQPAVLVPYFREWNPTSPIRPQFSLGFIRHRRKFR
jgi:hypothetical protein